MRDITWLKTDVCGIYYYAYVIEDLYDRSIVGWMIFDSESDIHAAELFDATCRKENCHSLFAMQDEVNSGIQSCGTASKALISTSQNMTEISAQAQ